MTLEEKYRIIKKTVCKKKQKQNNDKNQNKYKVSQNKKRKHILIPSYCRLRILNGNK